MQTATYPKAVKDLIEALSWRAERFGQTNSAQSLGDQIEKLPMLFLMEKPYLTTFDDGEGIAGYDSIIDFLANASPDSDNFPHQVMCLVTIGDSHRPHFKAFRQVKHAYDVRATAATILAYYEGKEKLPAGFTKEAIDWLTGETSRLGYGTEDSEDYKDKKGQEAVALFYDAILSISDVTEAPMLMQIFSHSCPDANFAYSSQSYTVGRTTRLFCRTFASPVSEHYNEILADMFEWKARELLTWSFLRNVGYKYGLDVEATTYRTLPPPRIAGALTHLPMASALNQHGSNLLES